MTDPRPVYDAIRHRRAVRDFTAEPVADAAVERILRAVRWAPSAGNRRLHKVVVLSDPSEIARVRALSPGLVGVPPLLLVLCTDATQLEAEGVHEHDTSTMLDAGTAAMCMMLAAQELGLATCPTTSFSAEGVRGALNMPPHLTPDFILQVGYAGPTPPGGAGKRIATGDFTYWGSFPGD